MFIYDIFLLVVYYDWGRWSGLLRSSSVKTFSQHTVRSPGERVSMTTVVTITEGQLILEAPRG